MVGLVDRGDESRVLVDEWRGGEWGLREAVAGTISLTIQECPFQNDLPSLKTIEKTLLAPIATLVMRWQTEQMAVQDGE